MRIVKNFFNTVRGTAAIEFAVVLPVFLLFIFGSIEFGYLLWADSTLKYGANYGARYAFVHPTASSTEIENFALSTTSFSGSVITYVVTKAPLFVDIDGSLTYNFVVIPLSPITLTVQQHQLLPLPS